MNLLTESEVLSLQNKLKKLLETQLENLTEISQALHPVAPFEIDSSKYFNKARHELKELYTLLKEHTVYEVNVKLSGANVKHKALLFTGFKNGSYWNVFAPSYEQPFSLETVYSIQIVKKIMKWE